MGDAHETLPQADDASGKPTAADGVVLDDDGLLAGKYRIAHLIARGGMGSVWHGTHVTLDRPVAVKFVDVAGRRDEQIVERFLREARTAAAIRHPNVVDIVDFGTTQDGKPFMVMELLEGETLLERIRREPPLSTADCVGVITQLLSGLDAVHRSGIVHRDLKPANVFLSGGSIDGDLFARLLDFGISYSVDPASELRRGRFGTDERLIIGTPEYMSPEQTEGRPDVDMRTDVYAVGVMLYEMLSGVLPFEGEHPGTVMHKVMGGSHVPLVDLRPDLSELSAVVAQAMSLDRDRRPPTARDLRRMILSAVGLAPDVSGSFPAGRTSSVHRRLDPISEPLAGGTDPARRAPVSRDAPTGAFEATPSSPPPSGRRVWGIGVPLGIVLALVGTFVWLSLRSTPSPIEPARVVAAHAPTVVVAAPTHVPETTVAAAPTSAPPPSSAAPTTHAHARARVPVAEIPPDPASAAPVTDVPPPTTAAPHGLVHDLDF